MLFIFLDFGGKKKKNQVKALMKACFSVRNGAIPFCPHVVGDIPYVDEVTYGH